MPVLRHHTSPWGEVSVQANVAVLLVNCQDYAEKYLRACYESLGAQTYPASFFTVFIVNNGATEESERLVAQMAPTARMLSNAKNLGWAGGNNTAVRVALREGFDHLVMLNMDAVVDPDWLSSLVEAADQRPDVHILQSKILLFGTDKLNSIGNRTHFLGYGYCDGYGQDSHRRPSHRIDHASGAAMLVKREVFERIGLFRDDYFMYYDDLEFCWRARLAGYNVGVAERSVCSHRYTTVGKLNYLYYLQRNRLVTLLTLERLGTILLTLPCLILAELVASIYCLARGWGRVQWRVARYFFRPGTWRAIIAGRREIRRLRTRKDAEIVKYFTGRVVFAETNPPILRYVFNPLLALYWACVRVFIVW